MGHRCWLVVLAPLVAACAAPARQPAADRELARTSEGGRRYRYRVEPNGAFRVDRLADPVEARLGALLAEGRRGLVVKALLPGGPAEAAGLLPGDRLVAAEGRPVRRRAQLAALLNGRPAAQPLAILWRRGAETGRAVLGPPPPGPAVVTSERLPPAGLGRDDRRTGVLLARPPPAVAAALGGAAEAGVVVAWVRPGGPAYRAGLRPGDRILAVAGHPAQDAAQTAARLREAPAGEWLSVRVIQGGASRTVRLRAAFLERKLFLDLGPVGRLYADPGQWDVSLLGGLLGRYRGVCRDTPFRAPERWWRLSLLLGLLRLEPSEVRLLWVLSVPL